MSQHRRDHDALHGAETWDADARRVGTILIAILSAFKVVTSAMVLYFFPSWEAVVLLCSLSVLWIVGAGIFLGDVTRSKFRLLNARMHRKQLVRSEWRVD